MKISEEDLFKTELEDLNYRKFNKFQVKLLITYYKIMERLTKNSDYYRKRELLKFIYNNQKCRNYYCNMCSKLVLRGDIAGGLVTNCPHCGSKYYIYRDWDNKLSRATISTKTKISEDEMLHTLLNCKVKILGHEYNIKS